MDALPKTEPEINKLFRMTRKHEASELHLYVESAPQMKLRGIVRTIDMRPLTQQDLDLLVAPILYKEQQELLSVGAEVEFTYVVDEGDAYHVSISKWEGHLSLTARSLSRSHANS